MFYYLLHIPLIHATGAPRLVSARRRVGAGAIRDGSVRLDSRRRAVGLPLLYLVFAIDVALLYVACRWFAGVKARRQDGWLRYV